MCVFVTEYDHTGVLSYCYVDYTYLEDYGTAKSMVIHVETIVYHVTEASAYRKPYWTHEPHSTSLR
jgi:hypothetical protein